MASVERAGADALCSVRPRVATQGLSRLSQLFLNPNRLGYYC